jgi:hypothetical protein
MLAHDATGMGHSAYVFVYPYGSTTNGVTFTPGGIDTADLATAPPMRVTRFSWDGTRSKWVADYSITQAVAPPTGRLTLTSGTAVLTGTVAGAGTVYYTPHNGNTAPIWDGSRFVAMPFAELSNVLANSTTGKAGPAAAANNSNYDLFVWNDAGTLRLTRGPAWSSDTARGAGAGTTEIERVNGLWRNKVAITNGPAAGYGTYVGTARTNGTATVDWIPGAVAANGTAAVLGVWNAHNRIEVRGLIGDTTDSWGYGGTWRAANASNTMRVSMVVGLQEDFFEAQYVAATAYTGGVVLANAGIGYNSTSAPSGRYPLTSSGNVTGQSLVFNPQGDYAVQPLGFNFMQALENGGSTWYGDNGGSSQNGLTYCGRF